MPVVLAPTAYDSWLDDQVHDVDRLLPSLAPYPPEARTAHPVSLLVNNPANDSPAYQSSGA
jgi:putative SOS response-associated peptidase YedK